MRLTNRLLQRVKDEEPVPYIYKASPRLAACAPLDFREPVPYLYTALCTADPKWPHTEPLEFREPVPFLGGNGRSPASPKLREPVPFLGAASPKTRDFRP